MTADAARPDFIGRVHRAAAAARDRLARCGAPRWELFVKASSTHRVVRLSYQPRQESLAEETGVAVRVTTGGGSGFAAASGIGAAASRRAIEGALAAVRPSPVDPIPPARLLGTVAAREPAAEPPVGWAGYTADRLAEIILAESRSRLQALSVSVDEGRYAWILSTAEGFVAAHRGDGCSVTVQLAGGEGGSWTEWLWIPDPAGFDAAAAAGRIVNRALLTARTAPPRPGMRDVLLHGEVAAHLVAALAPLFLAAPGRADPVPRLVDRDGCLAAPCLSLVDDRGGRRGPLAAPCDGEGFPARRITLLEHGVPRHRIGCYRDAVLCEETPHGGARRISYREPPTSGFHNLTVATEEGVPPGALLTMSRDPIYLTRLITPVEIDAERNLYRILASGLSLADGRPESWHPVVELRGGLGPMLRNIEAVGTDLGWYQTAAGYVGAPSVLVRRQATFEGG